MDKEDRTVIKRKENFLIEELPWNQYGNITVTSMNLESQGLYHLSHNKLG